MAKAKAKAKAKREPAKLNPANVIASKPMQGLLNELYANLKKGDHARLYFALGILKAVDNGMVITVDCASALLSAERATFERAGRKVSKRPSTESEYKNFLKSCGLPGMSKLFEYAMRDEKGGTKSWQILKTVCKDCAASHKNKGRILNEAEVDKLIRAELLQRGGNGGTRKRNVPAMLASMLKTANKLKRIKRFADHADNIARTVTKMQAIEEKNAE